MTQQFTVQELKQFFTEVRQKLGLESYRNCGAIASELRNELLERYENIDAIVAEGHLTTRSLRGVGPEHAFIVVEPIYLSDSESRVIFDPSLDQFSKEHTMGPFSVDMEDNIDPVEVTRGTRNDSFPEDIFYVIEKET